MTHEKLIDIAKLAIDKVFSDTSVPAKTTLDSLQTLRDEIEMKIDAVKNDVYGEDE